MPLSDEELRKLRQMEMMAQVPPPAQAPPVRRVQLFGRVSVSQLADGGVAVSILSGNADIVAYDYAMQPALVEEVALLLVRAMPDANRASVLRQVT